MASFYRNILLTFAVLLCAGSLRASRCPENYRYRVETCVMEAQVAPQAGGGLALIMEKDKLKDLCERGILHKTIDCLQELYDRCSDNSTRKYELDMLFNIKDWKQGMSLLCEDLNRKLVFSDHFDCLSPFGPRIFKCIQRETHLFKKAVTSAGLVPYKVLHDITCNFAENVVSCLGDPLAKACPQEVVYTMVSALHRFLPPACAPVPAVFSNARLEGQKGRGHKQPTMLETVILEGGDGAI